MQLRAAVLSLCALLLAASAAALQEEQARQVPRLKLKVKHVYVASEFNVPIMAPFRCDSNGNVYLRFYQFAQLLAAPIVKLSAEAKTVARFSPGSVPGFKNFTTHDFAVDGRGGVHLLVTNTIDERNEPYILSFREDGTHERSIRLSGSFRPARLALFPTGDFLVTGLAVSLREEDSRPDYEPFTGIFDATGSQLRKLTLPGDVKLQPQTESPGKNSTKPAEQQGRARAPLAEVSTGEALVGQDGNVYLMRRTAKPLVYVISPAGELLRKLEVAPPSEKAEPWAMKYGGGKLVVTFNEPAEKKEQGQIQIISLVDTETGERQMDYVASGAVGGGLICYTPNSFRFFGSTEDGHLTIEDAVPY